MRAALALCVLAACGTPEKPRAAGGEPRADVGADGGHAEPMKLCVRDAKDTSPCVMECDRGIAEACSVLAARLEKSEASRAVVLHERACELELPGDCVLAARMHAAGRGVVPSRPRQMDLLARACVLGDASSCVLPAKAYGSGGGVDRNERRARELWERACTGGVEAACDLVADAGP